MITVENNAPSASFNPYNQASVWLSPGADEEMQAQRRQVVYRGRIGGPHFKAPPVLGMPRTETSAVESSSKPFSPHCPPAFSPLSALHTLTPLSPTSIYQSLYSAPPPL